MAIPASGFHYELRADALFDRLRRAKEWHKSYKFVLWFELGCLVLIYGLAFYVPYLAPAIAWVASVFLALLANTREWHRAHKFAFGIEFLILTVLYAVILAFPALSPLFVWIASIILALFVGIYVYFIFEFLIVIGLMWVPASIAAIAACLLFLSDQGLDLGVGLLGRWDENLPKYVLLAPVLFYWAVASWHAGRRSLDRRFPTYPVLRPDDERFAAWLRWPPRLVGICAHLFAAITLSLAASRYLKPRGELLRTDWVSLLEGWAPLTLITWGPVIIIIIGTIYLWSSDYLHLHDGSRRGTIRINQISGPSFVLSILFFFLVCWAKNLLNGFSFAVLSILISWSAFMYLVFQRRSGKLRTYEEELKRDRRKRRRTVLLLGVAAVGWLVFLLLSNLNPFLLGDKIGSMIVAFFAFGAIVSAVDALSIPLDFYIGKARRDERIKKIWQSQEVAEADPHASANRDEFTKRYSEAFEEIKEAKIAEQFQQATFPVVCGLAILVAVSTSQIRTYDDIRMCKDTECLGDMSQNSFSARPTLDEAVDAWYEQARAAWDRDNNNGSEGPVPLVVVATAGGGIRAAYWTATVIENLRDQLSTRLSKVQGSSPDRLRPYLFAISSVSGGSLGAAAYSATLLPEQNADSKGFEKPTQFLEADFLAPALASMFFHDGLANLLPFYWGPDRGVALERSFEAASYDKLSRPFLSFFPRLKSSDATKKSLEWRPILLFNATHQKTGRRIIQSPVVIERDVFVDAYDALDLFQSDTRMSTAVLDSARFLYISPPGRMPHGPNGENRGYIIDGGYYENFGAQTALELVDAVERILANTGKKDKVRIFVVQISSDPSMRASSRPRTSTANGTCEVSTSGHGDAEDVLRFEDAPFDWATWSSKGDDEGPEINFLNELWSPLAGVMSTRESRGRAASEQLAVHMCSSGSGNFYHLAMCDPDSRASREQHIEPPLGWVLSSPSRGQIRQILKLCGNSEEMGRLIERMVPKPSE